MIFKRDMLMLLMFQVVLHVKLFTLLITFAS